MPLKVNEINKIDERFFFQSGNILFFFRGVDWDKSWKEHNNKESAQKSAISWFVAKFFTLELIHFN